MSTVRVLPPLPVSFELLEEPPLVFGGLSLARDPKAGLALAGPAGLDTALHTAEIDIALIGTGATIEAAQRWIENCANVIPGNSKKPRQVPDFPGFSPSSPFKSSMRPQQAIQGLITDMDVRGITSETRYEDGFKRAVDLLTEKVTLTCESLPGARVIFCAIPQPIVDYCLEAGSYLRRHGTSNAFMSKLLQLEVRHGQLPLFAHGAEAQRSEDIVYRNLRRALKATTMKFKRPLQLGLETSLFSARSQHPATKAWNFCVAQYYKATGALPWKLEGMDPNTCFVGISFFQEIADSSFKMRTSLAQVFSGDGEAFVVRGHPFRWEHGKTPHLPRDGAEALMKLIIDRYKEFKGDQPPQRVVIHKTSKFYEDECEGFVAGLSGVRRYDLVSIQKVGTRFFREGGYPPLRRTYASCGTGHFLYTLGYVPELGTYPKGYVPEPWYLLDHHGDTTPRRLFKEILALSKMNFNNVDFADGDPITTRFAQRIGEILAYMKEGDEDKHYRYYM
jgi:hypothetical protein